MANSILIMGLIGAMILALGVFAFNKIKNQT